MSSRRDPWSVDLYASGSCVYRLDKDGNVVEIVAWAKNAWVAGRAFEALAKEYPGETFQQRRKAHIEKP